MVRSWKEIRQSGTEKPMTSAAKRRRISTLLKASCSLLLFIALIGGGTWVVLNWVESSETRLGRERATPIRQILFQTDGVLSEKWAGRTLALRPGTTLLDHSIFELKERLEESGQVRSAVVERQFPDILKIVVKERFPVARVAVEDEFGSTETLLVAPDGTLYRGRDYDRVFLKTLPYLAGVLPRKDKEGHFHPLPGMELPTAFLRMIRTDFPELYGALQVLDLEDLRDGADLPGAGFVARLRRYPDIRFSPNGFKSQLEKLELVLADLEERIRRPEDRRMIDRVDLSITGPVVVSFLDPQKAQPPQGSP